MEKFKKIFFLLLLMLSVICLSCSISYAASYHYALTDMTWAEFYEGETGKTKSVLLSEGLDAVSTPTIAAAGSRNLFPQLSFDIDEANTTTTIYGIKAVQVRMTDDVYNALSSDTRYTFTNSEYSEYKDVNSDGSFGKMIEASTTRTLSNASVSLVSGASARWGNYVLEISNADITIGSGDTRYWLGALVEVDGKIYGMRHDSNLWRTPNDIALSIEAFTEPHGVTRDYKYTADIAGKTVKKITYILKDAPDVVINCDVLLKNQTTATVKPVYPEGLNAYEAGMNLAMQLAFSDIPSGAAYKPASVSYIPTGGGRRDSQAITDYTYSETENVLTINGMVGDGTYTITFKSDNYADIAASVKVFTTVATGLIISPDNNLGNVNFLITPAGIVNAVDEEMARGNFINASEYTNPANNYSVSYSGAWHEVEGSGFSFDITLIDVPSDKTAVAGFGKIFYLTPGNCGELFPSIYAAINSLEVYPSGYSAIAGDQFKNYGLRVMGIYDGEKIDVTEYVGAGVRISDDKNIEIYYGVMLADCNENEINEGATYMFSTDGETLLSDRKRDGHLKLTWHFEILSSESESVDNANNNADIQFSYLPSGFFASADRNAEDLKLTWLSKENNNVLSGGSSSYITGRENQIAGNSGFSFTIPVNAANIPEGFCAITGFERPFAFTAENIGADDFAVLTERVSTLPGISASDSESEWKTPGSNSGALLKAANIHVMAEYPDGPARDVTDEIQYSIKQEGSRVIINYGAIAVDRALTGSEGQKLDMVFEQSPLMSDGKADGNVTASWYLAHTQSKNTLSSSGSGCNALNFAGHVMLFASILILANKK